MRHPRSHQQPRRSSRLYRLLGDGRYRKPIVVAIHGYASGLHVGIANHLLVGSSRHAPMVSDARSGGVRA